jgi:hypothetical protein
MPTTREEFEFAVRSRGSLDEITRDLNALTRALDDLAKKEGTVSEAGTKAEKSLAGMTKPGGLNWRQTAQDIFFAGQAIQTLAGSVKGVLDTANALRQLGDAQRAATLSLEAVAGTRYDDYMDAISEATLGTVTQTDAAALAVKELRLKLVDSADEAERFTHTMAIIAASNPELGGTAEAVNQIALTIANMSYMRLDQLGLSAATVRARVNELKDEIKGLSTEEAFKMAVFEELDKQAAQLGDTILQTTDATHRLGAEWTNLKANVGERISLGIEGLIEGVPALLKAVYDLEKAELTGGKGIAYAGDERLDWDAPHDPTKYGWGAILAESEKNRRELYELDRRLMEEYYAKPENQVPFLFEQYGDYEAFYARQRQERLDQGLGVGVDFALGQEAHRAERYYETMIEGFQESTNRAMQTKQAIEMVGKATAAASSFMGIFTDGVNQLDITKAEALDAAMGQLDGRTRRVTESMAHMTERADRVGQAVLDAADKFDSLDEAFGLSPDAFNLDVAGEVQSALDAAGVSAENAADALFIYEHATGISNVASATFESQLATLSAQFGQGTLSAGEYVAAVQALENLDMSALNAMGTAILNTQGMDEYTAFLDTLKSFDMSQLEQAAKLPETVANTFQNLFDVVGGKGGAGDQGTGPEGRPATPQILFVAELESIPQRLDDVATAADERFIAIRDSGIEQFTALADGAEVGTARMQAAMNNLKGAAFTLSLSVMGVPGSSSPGAAPPGGRAPTAMAKGGRVLKGVEYIGGEEGFELFIPDTDGDVLNHMESLRLLKAIQSVSIPQMVGSAYGYSSPGFERGAATYNFYGAMHFPNVRNTRQFIRDIEQEMKRQNKPFGRG